MIKLEIDNITLKTTIIIIIIKNMKQIQIKNQTAVPAAMHSTISTKNKDKDKN